MVTGVHLQVGEDRGDLEGVDQVGLAGVADLAAVLEGREDVGPPEQLDVGVRVVLPDFFQQVLEADHRFSVSNVWRRRPHTRS